MFGLNIDPEYPIGFFDAHEYRRRTCVTFISVLFRVLFGLHKEHDISQPMAVSRCDKLSVYGDRAAGLQNQSLGQCALDACADATTSA